LLVRSCGAGFVRRRANLSGSAECATLNAG
jgi:hypothetical protein